MHRLYYRVGTVGERGNTSPDRRPVAFHPVRVLPDRAEPGVAAPIEIRVIRVPRGVAPEELRAVLAALEPRG